jgi:hypothetical protein
LEEVKVRREKVSRALAAEFIEMYGTRFREAISVLKRRTRVVGIFPSEVGTSTLATEIALRSSEH